MQFQFALVALFAALSVSDFATRDVEVSQLIFNRSEKATIEAEDATWDGYYDLSVPPPGP